MVFRKSLILITMAVVSCKIAAQSNLQNYTPSILFDKGDWEVKSFQNLYWQSKIFDGIGTQKVESPSGTQLWLTSINQFLYGINNQINVGIDVWGKHTAYEQTAFGTNTAIVGIGPKIKIAPFKNLKRLSIQSTFLFPLANDLENREESGMGSPYFLHEDASLWLTQFFYDKPLSEQFQLFFQQAFWYHFARNSFRSGNYLKTQTSIFLNYFPNNRWTLYAMSEYFPTHYSYISESDQGANAFDNFFIQSGIGLKYQLIFNKLELELLATDFWAGSNGQGAGQTVNLGLRWVKQ